MAKDLLVMLGDTPGNSPIGRTLGKRALTSRACRRGHRGDAALHLVDDAAAARRAWTPLIQVHDERDVLVFKRRTARASSAGCAAKSRTLA
jgi:hypothetical protein